MSEQPRGGAGFYMVVLVGAFLIMFYMVGSMMDSHPAPPIDETRAAERRKRLESLREAEAKAMTNFAWQNQEKGIVRLTVGRAMELTVAEAADPALARSNLLARLAKATFVAPAAPEKPSEYE